jgi:MurNAc alpha-1-phosphate uridylyltransferase
MKAMILAAGKGTRLKPFTDSKPKVLLEIEGITLLEHTVNYLRYHGVKEMIINIHHYAGQVLDFLRARNYFDVHIEISDEREGLLDTGGGLQKARWFFNDGNPFILCGCDMITDLDLRRMMEYHLHNMPLATLAVKQRTSTRDFLFDKHMVLCGWRHNLTGEIRMVRPVTNTVNRAFSVIHIIDPVLFDLVSEVGAFSMTDLYLRLAADHVIKGFDHSETSWYEFGRIENLNLNDKKESIQQIIDKYRLR